MIFSEITQVLTEQFGIDSFSVVNQKANQPIVQIQANQLFELCQFLANDERLFFDYLACITGIDNGPTANTMEVIYHLTSIPYEHNLAIKVIVERPADGTPPKVPSISSIWRTADWHERETYDLVGIFFENHPDLRRILLPNDWHGHPLRKDYQAQEFYHGIKVIY